MSTHAVPQFPLTANVWRYLVDVTTHAPILTPPCQLYVNREGANCWNYQTGGHECLVTLMYTPALTDLRAYSPRAVPDTVEVPAGSGRYYRIEHVEDFAKGFPNEFRVARIAQYIPPTAGGAAWPFPTP